MGNINTNNYDLIESGVNLSLMNPKEFCKHLRDSKLITCRLYDSHCIITNIYTKNPLGATIGLFRYSQYSAESLCNELIMHKVIKGKIISNVWITK